MLTALLWGLLFLGIPVDSGKAQASHVTAPANDYLLKITQAWGRESALGELTSVPMASADVELRFWQGYGLFGEWGVILRRRDGLWKGWRAAITRCQIMVPMAVGDTLSPTTHELYRQRARAGCGAKRSDTLHAGWVITADTVGLYALPGRAEYEEFWAMLKSNGLLELPPRIPRSWGMVDGHAYVVEVRRGGDYRASVIQQAPTLEARGDTLVQRLASVIDEWVHALDPINPAR